MSVAPVVVLDTNIVLDLWLYQDPAVPPLRDALQQGQVRWLSTPVMREELARVLAYPHIAARLAARPQEAQAVLDAFDAHVQVQADAPRASYVCKDVDDQKFVDLAAAHQAVLLSKDKAVLTLRNRLARVGVTVAKVWPAV